MTFLALGAQVLPQKPDDQGGGGNSPQDKSASPWPTSHTAHTQEPYTVPTECTHPGSLPYTPTQQVHTHTYTHTHTHTQLQEFEPQSTLPGESVLHLSNSMSRGNHQFISLILPEHAACPGQPCAHRHGAIMGCPVPGEGSRSSQLWPKHGSKARNSVLYQKKNRSRETWKRGRGRASG